MFVVAVAGLFLSTLVLSNLPAAAQDAKPSLVKDVSIPTNAATMGPYRLKEISCTACNHRGVSLDFRATMSVRESIYFVTCGGCKRQFAEQSSLEAFE